MNGRDVKYVSKRTTITPERAIELEIWLLENCSIGLNREELLNLLTLKNFSQSEIEYLISAYEMPLTDIRKKLAIYDTARPRIDSSELISALMINYIYDEAVVIKRIRSIRAINKYLKNNPNIVFSDVRVYNKLVRDNIPDIIESSGEKAIYHVLNEEEYWDYLLKKDSEELEEVRQASTKEEIKEELSDKLELIRAMANYHGFTLDEIVEAADVKKEKKGAFSKRLVLEKTYRFQNNND